MALYANTCRRVSKVSGSPGTRRSTSAVDVMKSAFPAICHAARQAGVTEATATAWANAVATSTTHQRLVGVRSSAASRTAFAGHTTPI